MSKSVRCGKVISFELIFSWKLYINHRFQCLTTWENGSTKSLHCVFPRQDLPDCLWKIQLLSWNKPMRIRKQVSWSWDFSSVFISSSIIHYLYFAVYPNEPTRVQSSSASQVKPWRLFQSQYLRCSRDWRLFLSQAAWLSHGGTEPTCSGMRVPREQSLASDAEALSSCCSDNEAGTTTVVNWCNRMEGAGSPGS